MSTGLHSFIRGIPKAELHLHIEGTLEPEMVFRARGQATAWRCRTPTVEAVRRAYDFDDLQSFLDLYYEGASVLRDERDFYDLTRAYLERAHADRASCTPRSSSIRRRTPSAASGSRRWSTASRAALESGARELGVSHRLILCFLRHLERGRRRSPRSPRRLPTATGSLRWASTRPRSAIRRRSSQRVFARARAAGLPAVAHAGEEGPPEYIREALDLLHVARIDHGVRSEEDPALVERLAREQIPLTVCPLSNVKLRVFAPWTTTT